jgi:hypothetical protein
VGLAIVISGWMLIWPAIRSRYRLALKQAGSGWLPRWIDILWLHVVVAMSAGVLAGAFVLLLLTMIFSR